MPEWGDYVGWEHRCLSGGALWAGSTDGRLQGLGVGLQWCLGDSVLIVIMGAHYRCVA